MATDKTERKHYFLAIIPPSPTYEQVDDLKRYCQEKFNTKAALRSPPHITLQMPFWWPAKKEKELIQQLEHFAKHFDPFKVCLDNFGAFPPGVIYINVVKSLALEEFQLAVKRFCNVKLQLFDSLFKDAVYRPHLTIAFRDLKKPMFKAAWDELKDREFKAEFVADRLALLKHNGKNWEVIHEFQMESSYSTDQKSTLETTEG